MRSVASSKKATIKASDLEALRRELHETQDRLQTALKVVETAHNDASIGAWERDLVADKFYWSDRLKQMFGITDLQYIPSSDEVLGRVHPDNAEQWTNQFAAAISVNMPINMEIRIRRKDRIYVWLHFLGKVAPSPDGTGRRVTGSALDISYRKDSELARIQIKERFDLALQSLSVGIFDWNLVDRTLHWSLKYKQMLGILDADYQPQPADFDARIHPDDAGNFTIALQAHIKRSVPFDIECRLRHNDGRYLWMRLCGMTERNAKGKALRMVGSVDDISIRKQAVHKLSIREARLRNMFDFAVDGLITIDTKGIVQYYNPACEKMFGFSEVEVVGQNVSMLMPEPFRAEHDRYVGNYLSTGHAKIIGIGREVEGRRKDGSVFPLDLSISQFKAGGETLFSGIVRDITGRKQAERIKSEFISVVSHELRTPLTSIRGSLGLLFAGLDAGLGAGMSPNTQELLRIAHRNSELLMILINDILDIEKLQSGAMRLTLKPVDLEVLLADAVSANSNYASRYGVTMRLRTEPSLPLVIADPDRLIQIMANLLSNAAKYTRQGTVIDVRAQQKGEWVKISVRDHGQGVSNEMKLVLFEKFAQGDPSNLRERAGTGLGLAIVRELAQLMNSEVGFTSVRGKGATFFIKLPLAKPGSNDLPPPRGAKATGRGVRRATIADRGLEP
jgi:PAS domain S-box-containing protein